jgi:hypothetical protein
VQEGEVGDAITVPLVYCMCNPEVAKVCTDNFIEGFIKGAKFIQSKMKNNESKGKSNR